MQQHEAEQLADGMAAVFKDYVGRNLAPLMARIAALESRQPEKGERGDPGMDGAAGSQGEAGPPGPAGRDGRDGLAGRDGVDGLAGKDGANGLDGKDGADGLGFDELSVEFDGERTLKWILQKDEVRKEYPVIGPWLIDRGVWKTGVEYQRGDGVTWGGSFWTAQKATTSQPHDGDTDSWRLAVKKGRDGRDGKPGEKGETGPIGRAGRDLTQLGPDGSKW